MTFLTRLAVPRMVAICFIRNRMYLVFVFALGTIPARLTTIGDLMPVLTIGTIPGMGTERLRIMVVTRAAFAIGAVPVAGETGFVVSVSRCIVGAPPAVRAGFVRVVTSSKVILVPVAFAVFAPKVMRTAIRFSVSPHALVAEPAPLLTRIRRRMVRFFALGACPVMRAAVGRV